MNENNGNFTYIEDIDDTIYIRACNSVGCSEPTNGTKIKIDTTAPTITAKSSIYNFQIGTSSNVSNCFSVTYSKSGGTLSCSPANIKSLALGTHTVTCTANGSNGLSRSTTTKVDIKPLLPKIPTVVLRYNNSSGSTYNGSWTSNSVYFGLSAATGDTVTYYQYKIGSTGTWTKPSNLTMSDNNGSFTYSSNIDNNIYIRACNSSGCSSATSGSTIKIDKTAPTITAKSTSYTITVGDSNNTSDYFNVTYSISGGTLSCSLVNTKTLSVGTSTVTCTATGSSGLTKSASTTVIVNPKTPSVPTVVTRNTNASGSIYSGSWTYKSIYFALSAGKTSDVVSYYQYKVGTSGSWNNVSASSNSGSFTYSNNINNTIYIRACNVTGCSDATSGSTIKIDKTAPTITAKSTSYTITVGDSNNTSDYFNVTYSISGGTLSCSLVNTKTLSVGTSTVTCTATGSSGLTKSASTTVIVNPKTPSVPTVVTRNTNASGSIYSGSWTYKSIYFALSAGKTSDVVSYYQYKVGTSGSWNNVSASGNSGNFTYSSDIDDTIYVRACNSSNCSDASSGSTIKIDTGYPTLTAKNSSYSILEGASATLSSYFTVIYSTSGGSISCSPSKTETLTIGEHTITCTATGGNGLSKSATTKVVINPLLPNIPSVVLRYNNASGSIYNNTWTYKPIYFGLSAGKTSDTVTYYQYRFSSQNTSTTPSNLSMSGNNGSFVYSNNVEDTIYIKACNSTGCSAETSGSTIKIDTGYPTISAKSTSYTITQGSSNTISSYFNVSYSSSSGNVICSPLNTSTLSIGTHTVTCVATGGNGLTKSASTKVYVKSATPSVPGVNAYKGYFGDAEEYYGNGSWTNSDLVFYYGGGGNPDYYRYRVGSNGDWQTLSSYNYQFVPDFGSDTYVNTTLYVQACYTGDKCSESWTMDIKIDKTPPTISGITTFACLYDETWYPNGYRNFKIEASDSGSGVSTYFIQTTDGSFISYPRIFPQDITDMLESGTYIFGIFDKAGNMATKTGTIASCAKATSSPAKICDISNDSSYFGTGKGSLSGNYGSYYTGLYFGYNWCYANGTNCYPTTGYDRVCVGSLCSTYGIYGKTARYLRNTYGCSFSQYWCSCNGSF